MRAPGRAAPLAFVLREHLPWLLAPAAEPPELSGDAQAVHELLVRRGASFTADVARGTGLAPAAVEAALWTLVTHGLVTGDGVAGLRLLIDSPEQPAMRSAPVRRQCRLLRPLGAVARERRRQRT
jgi:ATP-dependent Lhr-like helicase